MSNRVMFQMTKFVDLNENLIEGGENYGFRIADDYGQTYSNVLTKDEALSFSPEKALLVLLEQFDEFMNSVKGKGFYFNDRWISVDDNGFIL